MPLGSGLSSSASLCIALGRAWGAASGVTSPDQQAIALAAQAAEHEFAGVHCGIMDQMVIAHAEQGEAFALDCATLGFERLSLPEDWSVLIVQSGCERGLVEGEYNARRRDCEAAAAALGRPLLAQATADELACANLCEVVHRRARHVISEQARTLAAISALRRDDLRVFGRQLRESHASLRDDFEVSVAPVDRLVEVLDAAIGEEGGARMTGGGFGGAVVAVMRRNRLASVLAALRDGYRTPGGEPAKVMVETGGASGR
jgi:galactokinase